MLDISRVNFKQIISLRERIDSILSNLLLKKESLHHIHEELLTLNHTQLFVFGLDSLQFQQQLIQIEYDNMSKTFKVIDNRLYGDFTNFIVLFRNLLGLILTFPP